MYKIVNNATNIDGSRGKYSKKVQDPSICYGRNAIHNYKSYIKDLKFNPVELPDLKDLHTLKQDEFDKKMSELDKALCKIDKQKMPPIDFSCRYMPSRFINQYALMGAAYEAMGKKTAISTKELTKSCQKTVDEIYKDPKISPEMSASAVDINKDGKIDIAEYSTTILVADALSKSSKFDTRNIDGSFTNTGENSLLFFNTRENYKIANTTYRNLYKLLNLEEAQRSFLSDKNNLA